MSFLLFILCIATLCNMIVMTTSLNFTHCMSTKYGWLQCQRSMVQSHVFYSIANVIATRHNRGLCNGGWITCCKLLIIM